RKVVGTIYKQEGRAQAIKIGLDYFGTKMRKMVEEVEEIKSKIQNTNSKFQIPNSHIVLVHCWRGGMRSAGVAWLLDLYGFKVYTLTGGYKSFRNWALLQFEKPYSFNIIGGYTGSGKTEILKELAGKGHAIIDLEGIARHKGSAFGGLGEAPQPTQEMFENILGLELHNVTNSLSDNECVWLEDESRRIGLVNIPGALWDAMRQSPVYFLEVPFEERLAYITEAYGKYEQKELVNSVMRIQKRLGGLDTKNAVNYLLEKNYKEAFRILLSYYDKYYERSLESRDNLSGLLTKVVCGNMDILTNTKKLIDKKQLSDGITNTGN
ncbi:MAG: tRNA 2-selenouridine(34) synthase MnmH, partial [Legionellales bacterium]